MKRGRRRYVMTVRERKIESTRKRIVGAAVALHEEMGPNRTTVSAIAERAGVERLTVYRHFPDERAILDACSSEWLSRNPPPDPEGWQGEAGPAGRTEKAFLALFAYYSRTCGMFGKLYRDVSENGALAEVMRGFEDYLDRIGMDVAAVWKRRGRRAGESKAIIRHALRFPTWASLEAEGLDDRSKARLLVRWLECLAMRPVDK